MNSSFAAAHPELVRKWSEKNQLKPMQVSLGLNKRVI